MHWHLLHSEPADGPRNMARDEALLTLARETGDGWLRVYGWSDRVLSLGRHQRAAGVYDPTRAAERGIQIVRRPTGGRAVLHWREVTYAAAATDRAGATLREASARIDRILLHALATLGVPATLASPAERAPAPDAAPCFALPVRGEILAGGAKLAGSAQWRDGGAWLQHGSVLVGDDQGLIAEVALTPGAQQVGTVSTLGSLLGAPPSVATFAAAIHAALIALEGPTPALPEVEMDAHLARLDEIAAPLVARYTDPAWIWRR